MRRKAKKQVSQGGIVYSTNPDFYKESEENTKKENISPERQILRIYLDKKNRKGKTVTLIHGFAGPEEDLKKLEKALKSYCGTGGSIKDGEILIQGDQKEKVFEYLKGKGYGVR